MGAQLIEWREEYSLGIPSVDHEHRELIDLLNELYNELLSARSESAVGHFFGELYARVSAHFALEEKVMREHQYDEYNDHKRDHERLLDEVRDLMDDYADGVWVDMDAFARRLERWFTDHFRSTTRGCTTSLVEWMATTRLGLSRVPPSNTPYGGAK